MDWKDEEVEDMAKRAYHQAPAGQTYSWSEASDEWKEHAREVAQVVATRAVELAAARGGTMTAEFLERCMSGLPSNSVLREHIAAIGARNAVLEAEVKRLSECAAVTETMAARRERDEARAEAEAARERLEKRTQELKAENGKLRIDISGHTGTISEQHETITRLQERLSAAEEGNRELVRRAQQAEAHRDSWRDEHEASMRRWKTERESAETWRRRIEAAAEELADVGVGEVGRLDIVSRVRLLKARCATLSAAGQVLSAHVDKADGECCHPVPMTHSGQRLHTLDCPVDRYPCSATCTHDDAAKPGHPERVKERSEGFKYTAEMKTGDDGVLRDEYSRGHNDGAEAMRAACLGSVLALCDQEGMIPGLRRMFQAAIEGASP